MVESVVFFMVDLLMHMLDLVVGRICRITSVTPNVELLVYFALMSRSMCYIYCCLHVDICLKLEP
jgi:hypothetical protein